MVADQSDAHGAYSSPPWKMDHRKGAKKWRRKTTQKQMSPNRVVDETGMNKRATPGGKLLVASIPAKLGPPPKRRMFQTRAEILLNKIDHLLAQLDHFTAKLEKTVQESDPRNVKAKWEREDTILTNITKKLEKVYRVKRAPFVPTLLESFRPFDLRKTENISCAKLGESLALNGVYLTHDEIKAVSQAINEGRRRSCLPYRKLIDMLEYRTAPNVQARLRESAAVKIQSIVRGGVKRTHVRCKRKAAVAIQKVNRGSKERTRYQLKKQAARKIQGILRGRTCRQSYAKTKAAVVRIQAWMRRVFARVRAKVLNKAATKIQASARGKAARHRFRDSKESAVRIQSVVRASNTRRDVKKRHGAAKRIQTIARGRNARHDVKRRHEAATKLQGLERGRQQRNAHKRKHQAATTIQALFRGHLVRRFIKRASEAAIVIQRAVRKRLAYLNELRLHRDEDQTALKDSTNSKEETGS